MGKACCGERVRRPASGLACMSGAREPLFSSHRKNAAIVKILALVPEAHGGFGGIATYSRDLIDACCELPRVRHVQLVPRIIRSEPVGLPAKAEMRSDAA